MKDSRVIERILHPEHAADAGWREAGFAEPTAARAVVAQLRAEQPFLFSDVPLARVVFSEISASCDPDGVLALFHDWLAAGGALVTPPGWDPLFLRTLFALFGATPALARHLIRFPSRTAPVIQAVLAREVIGGRGWGVLLEERLKLAENHAARLALLRRMRVECMLQIAALDLLRISPLSQTVRAMSDLADACIAAALRIAEEFLRPRMGSLAAKSGAPSPLIVFALGKLGGCELNYSSDIDLVFGHDASGETSGGSRSVTPLEYVSALAAEVIAILDKVTEDGRVYRVDVRLRPHGAAGPLVRSVTEMLEYYQAEGRTWERQAWLKARVAAGDRQAGGALLERLQPFIFRRFLTNDAIADMQALKRQIEAGVARRGESDDEVKLGRGGIRDIEFTIQFMQLLYGSDHPSVRGGNSLQALYELRREGLILDSEAVPLSDAYTFLRHVEHRLQLYGDLQVHLLPTDIRTRRRIALSLGYADGSSERKGESYATAQDAFEADRQRHMQRTREVFQRLFANLFSENRGTDGELSDRLLAPEPDLERIAELLPNYGLKRSEASARELLELSREGLGLTAPSRTRKTFAAIAPKLLKALAATGEPEQALSRFSRIAGSLGAKSIFYLTLNENPWLLKMTAELAAWSELLTGILVANPGLFDELVDALWTGQRKTITRMKEEVRRLTSGGDISDTLRAYRAGELLRIGVADLIDRSTLENTQEELSDLAAVILGAQLESCERQQIRSRGAVLDSTGHPVSFAVLGLGKFGGREMNYGSDLDVIYFYSDDGATTEGLPAVTYFAELAQALTRSLSTATSLGPLFELDARLRPNGSKGPLAISLADFKRYWKDGQLEDWERLALTRARFVAGDEHLGERALHLIASAIYSPLKDIARLSAEVISVRQRLEENSEPGDIKRGRGGSMDIQFVAQYLQLIHAPSQPRLRIQNTGEALRALVRAHHLDPADGEALLAAYHFLMTLENRLRIVHGLSSRTLPSKPEALRKLALRAGFDDAPELPAEVQLQNSYKQHTETSRSLFLKICGAARTP